MSLDYQIKKPQEFTKINSNDFGELLWWSYIMNASPEDILTTIDKVGNSSEVVRKYIKDRTR